MRKYLSFFRVRFISGLQYRAAALAGASTQFAWGGMTILMYKAFYAADPQAFPMEFTQLSSYIWMQQAFLALFNAWALDGEIFDAITSGSVAYELVRPLDLYHMWFTKNVATRLAKVILRCLPILVITSLLPAPYGLSMPASPAALMFCGITMVLGLFTVVAYCMLVYIATFYTLSPAGVRPVAISLVEFMSGALVPLPFLPGRLQRALELSPFAGIQNLPFRIYSGNIAGSELAFGILLQIFWLLVLVALGKLWMSRSLGRVVVQGG